MSKKIAIILPMYNEEKNAPLIVRKIQEVKENSNLDISIVAVNDGSSDQTGNILESLRKKFPFLIALHHPKNKGMAGAIRTGIKESMRNCFDILVFMDSDLTHNPEDIPRFVKKINEGFDYIVGSRYITGGGMKNVSLIRVLISKIGNFIGRISLNVGLTDLTSGFRAGKSEVFRKISLLENGFSIQLEGTVKTIREGFKVGEIPIILSSRIHGKSKMSYNFNFFKTYFFLLLKCRRWLKDRNE